MDLHLKGLFGRMNEQFGTGPGLGPGSGTCLMNVSGVTPSTIKSLYKAAAALFRTDPWKRLKPRHLLGVRVGKDSESQPFPCIQFIGGDGGDLALYLFRSESEAQRVTKPRKTLKVPKVEIFRVTFEKDSILFPSHRKLIRSLALEPSGIDYFPVFDFVSCNSSGELKFRNPCFEELRFVYAVMKAVPLVHPLLQLQEDHKLVCFQPFIETVDVQWLPEMVKSGNDFVAVAVSHPPGHSYQEKDPILKQDSLGDSDMSIDNAVYGLRFCGMCDKEFDGDQQTIYCSSCSSPFLS